MAILGETRFITMALVMSRIHGGKKLEAKLFSHR